jgi:protein-S-isoprenylcysteine O-methyltransferase Ste14
MVAVALPAAILLTGDGPRIAWGLPWPLAAPVLLAGVALAAAGFALWLWTVALFARVGEGTLAPWDPTRRLVVEGPYRRVRNPMISAVLAVLTSEALVLGSPGLVILCAAFVAVNQVYFVAHEEPGLERRFGAEYRAYKSAVPRWIPRGTGY